MNRPWKNPTCFGWIMWESIYVILSDKALTNILYETLSRLIGFQPVMRFGSLALGINSIKCWLIMPPRVFSTQFPYRLIEGLVQPSPKWIWKNHMETILVMGTYHLPSPTWLLSISISVDTQSHIFLCLGETFNMIRSTHVCMVSLYASIIPWDWKIIWQWDTNSCLMSLSLISLS